MQIRILSANDVRKALPMADAIDAMKSAFAQLSTGRATMPLRTHMDFKQQKGTTLIMPAYLEKDKELAVKVVSIFPENAKRNEPTVYAAVMVLDGQTGQPLAMMEGSVLTAIRTGAGSGAATEFLAPVEAGVVAILGSGVQARTQLEAMCCVRDIREVRVYSPRVENARLFAEDMQGNNAIPENILVTSSAELAVRGADIICTATTSWKPVLDHSWLKPGAHINGVGSYLPGMQEVDEETVKQAIVVVDSYEAALAEAGDLLIPMQSGSIGEGHIHAELGEIISGQQAGRTGDRQITFFKSVGVAVQDAVAGQLALKNAKIQNLGTVVEM